MQAFGHPSYGAAIGEHLCEGKLSSLPVHVLSEGKVITGGTELSTPRLDGQPVTSFELLVFAVWVIFCKIGHRWVAHRVLAHYLCPAAIVQSRVSSFSSLDKGKLNCFAHPFPREFVG